VGTVALDQLSTRPHSFLRKQQRRLPSISAAVLFIPFYLKQEYIDVLLTWYWEKRGRVEIKGKINIFQRFWRWYITLSITGFLDVSCAYYMHPKGTRFFALGPVIEISPLQGMQLI
jgi:hypothetical protein